MERYIYDENNGLWYELHGDYYLPCLALPDDKEEPYIGIWGERAPVALKLRTDRAGRRESGTSAI